MGEAGGQTDDRGNGQGSQGFHGCLRIFMCSYGEHLSGINLTETELPSLPLKELPQAAIFDLAFKNQKIAACGSSYRDR